MKWIDSLKISKAKGRNIEPYEVILSYINDTGNLIANITKTVDKPIKYQIFRTNTNKKGANTVEETKRIVEKEVLGF
jgi:hypothetical protein